MIHARNSVAMLQCFPINCLCVAEIDYKMPSDYCPQSAYEPENAFCNRAVVPWWSEFLLLFALKALGQ
jgi:hypothetical protein